MTTGLSTDHIYTLLRFVEIVLVTISYAVFVRIFEYELLSYDGYDQLHLMLIETKQRSISIYSDKKTCNHLPFIFLNFHFNSTLFDARSDILLRAIFKRKLYNLS